MNYKEVLENEIKKLQSEGTDDFNGQVDRSKTILEIVKYLESKESDELAAKTAKLVDEKLHKQFKETENNLLK